jgi:hypothetical protein
MIICLSLGSLNKIAVNFYIQEDANQGGYIHAIIGSQVMLNESHHALRMDQYLNSKRTG